MNLELKDFVKNLIIEETIPSADTNKRPFESDSDNSTQKKQKSNDMRPIPKLHRTEFSYYGKDGEELLIRKIADYGFDARE